MCVNMYHVYNILAHVRWTVHMWNQTRTLTEQTDPGCGVAVAWWVVMPLYASENSTQLFFRGYTEPITFWFGKGSAISLLWPQPTPNSRNPNFWIFSKGVGYCWATWFTRSGAAAVAFSTTHEIDLWWCSVCRSCVGSTIGRGLYIDHG